MLSVIEVQAPQTLSSILQVSPASVRQVQTGQNAVVTRPQAQIKLGKCAKLLRRRRIICRHQFTLARSKGAQII